MSTRPQDAEGRPAPAEALPISAIHHVEIWSGNAKQSEYYYRKAFGFSRIAYAGPETGIRDRASYVLAQDEIRLVITSPIGEGGEINRWLAEHGDGVRDMAFATSDVDHCHIEALARGAADHGAPVDLGDGVRRATVGTYGEVLHSFIDAKNFKGAFLPGYEASEIPEEGVGLRYVDHIVGNVEEGQMDAWRDWYERVLGWHQFLSFDDKDISTEFTALRSKVMSSPTGKIKFPINEPAAGKKKSQIQEYLDFNGGAGSQHLALLTDDIIKTIGQLRDRGVEFLEVPDSYYEVLTERVGAIDEDIEVLRKLKILVDRDDQGYLLQLFTKPVQDRPTLFYEIIQRKGSQSFGKGNFQALFESIEREQERRGNL
jgi:4-hydroxyphenylpyruvate dioxygenase